MSATNELRKLIKAELSALCEDFYVKEIYYQIADEKALFPHIVFSLDSAVSQPMFIDRYDYRLFVDVYFKGSTQEIEDLCDAIQEYFVWKNSPTTEILPTFYFENRLLIIEQDKNINHRQLRFNIQMYERN